MTSEPNNDHPEVTIRPMAEADIGPARAIYQLAFGAQNGAEDPQSYRADIDTIGPRWRVDPDAAWVAEIEGQVVGSNLATFWGSVGSLGPLTIHPEFWNCGIGQKLMAPAMELFEQRRTGHVALFTYAESPKHVELYRRYGFWPRFLTAVMSVPVVKDAEETSHETFSRLSQVQKREALRASHRITASFWPGLDLRSEIEAVDLLGLGDTILLHGDAGLTGFAVCHCGPETEAGEGNCFVKFGFVRTGPNAQSDFGRLLDACEGLAAASGRSSLIAGTNLARVEAYETMISRGFRTEIQGISMHRGNQAGYNRSGVFIIDDLR